MAANIYDYDKDCIKNSLTVEDVNNLLIELDANPKIIGDVIVSRTICHCGNSHKLYYYDNTKLFHCYTGCAEATFDIFQLVQKVKSKTTPKVRKDKNSQEYFDEWNLPECVAFVAEHYGFSPSEKHEEDSYNLEDWKIFNNYDRINDINIKTKIVELKSYDDNILKNLPSPKIRPWIDEGISKEVMDKRNIKYDPKNCGIVIPHYDVNNKLVGIRERTLVKEKEAKGKYKPALLNKQLYNHPLSFCLYNLNNSIENIKRMKKAIVYEGEKSPMLFASYFGEENDITVASCGSSFIQYQAWLLINLGVQEIIIAYDKQFKEFNDKEHKKLVQNLRNIHNKYSLFVRISFLFDKWNLLNYKDSPIDRGPDTFMKLAERRISL